MMNFIQLKWISTSGALHVFKPKGIIINKVFNFKEPKKKLKTINVPITPVGQNIKQKTQTSFYKNKRVTILNRIFMRHISDLMATGEVAPNLLDKEIEITKVQVSLDFSRINVYWFSTKNLNDIDMILENAAGHLQHELSQIQIIGQVPPIIFIKDLKFSTMQEMENHFSNIDLELTSEQTDNDNCLNDQNQSNENEIIVPEMQQNVMGFNQATVMNKIKTSMLKIQKSEINKVEDTFAISMSKDDQLNISKLLMANEEKKRFDEYVKKRMIAEKREKKRSAFFVIEFL
ncbi:PREDICTED: putative ribosome-binding factor A, mitochondrial [Ceratosolen solmsi marchali]|uniref:Ribosome-binding factor A, mitochondrial n=1 Tax=Ceratosolen solmsi marchali TaxID=326594 RepID=A0AAJ7DYC0_9HYME|nr:PREDICTED: putative ribosome-binding factor A, mitochondrial [Ceratosolen solmsi marchali]